MEKLIDEKSLGGKLKKKRISAGLCQFEIASLLGLSQPYVNMLESGKRKGPKLRDKILKLLKTKNEVLRFAITARAGEKNGKVIIPR